MCGILGLVRRTYNTGSTTEEVTKATDIFREMLVNSEQRGSDSTGMFLMNKKYKAPTQWDAGKDVGYVRSIPLATLNKAPIPAQHYVEDENYTTTMKYATKWTVSMVGHTRAATSGSRHNNVNNHPFLCGNILGVHNGIISNWREAASLLNIKLKSACDSEIIFALIHHFMDTEKMPISKAILEMSKHLNGWMACALADIRDPEKLILFRRGGPLKIRYNSTTPQTILFASQDEFIANAVKKVEEPGATLSLAEWSNINLPDCSGVILDTSQNLNEWVKKALLFTVNE